MKKHWLNNDNWTHCGIVRPIGEKIPGFVMMEGAVIDFPYDIDNNTPIIDEKNCCKKCLKYAKNGIA